MGNSVFLSHGRVCWGPSGVASGVSSMLSHFKREHGFFLEKLLWNRASSRVEGESRGFSRAAVVSLGFISSCDRDLRDQLVLPQRSQVSFRVARGPSGFLTSRCPLIGLFLEFSRETQCSLLWQPGSRASYQGSTRESGLA